MLPKKKLELQQPKKNLELRERELERMLANGKSTNEKRGKYTLKKLKLALVERGESASPEGERDRNDLDFVILGLEREDGSSNTNNNSNIYCNYGWKKNENFVSKAVHQVFFPF